MKKASMFILTAGCVGLSFGAIRAVTPMPRDTSPNNWWMIRHNEKLKEAKAGGAKVVFIGDSITHFWESFGQDQALKYFSQGNYRMLNLGTSADRTEHVLWRLTTGGELDGYEAKVICLMIGTNNTGHFKFEEETPIDTILGIRAVLKTIREKQPKAKIVLSAIFPRGYDDRDALRNRNDVVNKEIQKYADGKTIFWLDFSDRLLTCDGRLPTEIFPDALHPRGHGYEVWAAELMPYVEAALSDGRIPMPANRFSAPRAANWRMNLDDATWYPHCRIKEGYAGRDWYAERLLEKRNEIVASKGAFDVVLLGDSITHNWDNSKCAAALKKLRAHYSVLTLGYSGDTTRALIWRAQNGELDGYKAKCITLMIGTNNSEHPKKVAEGIRHALDLIARKQPTAKIVLMPIFPRGASAEDANRKRNEETNAIIRDYADGNKIVWLDFNAKFLDEKGDVAWIMSDRLHPDAKGYDDIWLPSMLPTLQKIIGK